MAYLFWGLTVTMLFAAYSFVAIPLKTERRIVNGPRLLVLFLLPLTSFGLYALLGSPDTVIAQSSDTDLSDERSNLASSERRPNKLGSVASVIDGLREKLELNPNDADGWLLLARSYQHIGQPKDAAAAYEHARSLGKTDAGFEALRTGAEQQLQVPAFPSAPAISGRVVISPEAAARINPDDTVFLFGKKSLDERMPVVALRKSAAELPFDFSLTDSEVMVPGISLADFEHLVVVARISPSGNAGDTSAGLDVWSKPVSPVSAETVELIIGARRKIEDERNE